MLSCAIQCSDTHKILLVTSQELLVELCISFLWLNCVLLFFPHAPCHKCLDSAVVLCFSCSGVSFFVLLIQSVGETNTNESVS